MHEHTKNQLKAIWKSSCTPTIDEDFLKPLNGTGPIPLLTGMENLALEAKKRYESDLPKRCAFATKVAQQERADFTLILPTQRTSFESSQSTPSTCR